MCSAPSRCPTSLARLRQPHAARQCTCGGHTTVGHRVRDTAAAAQRRQHATLRRGRSSRQASRRERHGRALSLARLGARVWRGSWRSRQRYRDVQGHLAAAADRQLLARELILASAHTARNAITQDARVCGEGWRVAKMHRAHTRSCRGSDKAYPLLTFSSTTLRLLMQHSSHLRKRAMKSE